MSSIRNVIETTGKLAAAVALSFLLFVFISMLHGLFGVDRQVTGKTRQMQQVFAEIIKEKPKEENMMKQRIRQVQQQSHQSSGHSETGGPATRFSPDLAVDGSSGNSGVEMQSNELSAEVFEEGQVDEPPREERISSVNFPERAREEGFAGTVVAKFTITYNGKVSGIDIVSSPDALLSNEVRRVLAEAKFKPGRNKGVPVNVRATKSFEFNLE